MSAETKSSSDVAIVKGTNAVAYSIDKLHSTEDVSFRYWEIQVMDFIETNDYGSFDGGALVPTDDASKKILRSFFLQVLHKNLGSIIVESHPDMDPVKIWDYIQKKVKKRHSLC